MYTYMYIQIFPICFFLIYVSFSKYVSKAGARREITSFKTFVSDGVRDVIQPFPICHFLANCCVETGFGCHPPATKHHPPATAPTTTDHQLPTIKNHQGPPTTTNHHHRQPKSQDRVSKPDSSDGLATASVAELSRESCSSLSRDGVCVPRKQ